ncbi:MAG: hypothetical protein KatS3mg105_4307 [Gemmatales bacterium]|nr:MAG: hypothetical protein KatS3mg105_4307 [Gemmatales bacterium]
MTEQLETAEQRGLIPPEEKFWQRYSANHEFPLSATSSLVLHGLALALLIGMGYILAKLGFSERERPLPVDAIVIAGGGGNPTGDGNAAGNLPRVEDVGDPKQVDRKDEPLPELTLPKPFVKEFVQTPDDARFIDETSRENVEKITRLGQSARDLLSRVQPGKGSGGPGSGGGKDRGKGPGEGDLTGPGKQKGTLNVRQKRVLRWVMMFNTRDGDDYRRQLAYLGAIIAVPEAGNRFRVYRDLTQSPPRGRIEDISETLSDRIFWVDDRPQSVASLARALGLRHIPPRIVAFFPQKLEEELLRKELAYRGRKEHEIKETRFRVQRIGNAYVPIVESQQ